MKVMEMTLTAMLCAARETSSKRAAITVTMPKTAHEGDGDDVDGDAVGGERDFVEAGGHHSHDAEDGPSARICMAEGNPRVSRRRMGVHWGR